MVVLKRISAPEFLNLSAERPVIDVRSPAEYLQGHIPGAVNIPLFNDEERAAVGTLYTRSGRDASVLKGLELAGPRLPGFVKQAAVVAPGKDILVHCWRGGMRSETMAWLFELAGMTVSILAGGYKAYRKFIREEFSKPHRLIILGGMTGAGKTDMLKLLEKAGEQVIDLEALANHKGSVFGALGQAPQPTNEQFENDLYVGWRTLDPEIRTWIEDESRMIGTITLPEPLFAAMNDAPMIRMETGLSQRVRRLVTDYSRFPKEALEESLGKIREKLGGTRYSKAMEALAGNDFETVAVLSLEYYDKAYEHAVSRRENRKIVPANCISEDPEHQITEVVKAAGLIFPKER